MKGSLILEVIFVLRYKFYPLKNLINRPVFKSALNGLTIPFMPLPSNWAHVHSSAGIITGDRKRHLLCQRDFSPWLKGTARCLRWQVPLDYLQPYSSIPSSQREPASSAGKPLKCPFSTMTPPATCANGHLPLFSLLRHLSLLFIVVILLSLKLPHIISVGHDTCYANVNKSTIAIKWIVFISTQVVL